MLAEAVIAAAEMELRGDPSERYLRPSGMSECPVRTYRSWKEDREPTPGRNLLLMNDGHYQETEMIDDLERAGFKITDRQLEVNIGGVMTGHLDGILHLDGKQHLLDCKAMNMRRYTAFKSGGFSAEPGIRVQMNLYLASDELQARNINTGIVYCKHKDTCRPYDFWFKHEKTFSASLIHQAKRLSEGWIPEPVSIPRCSDCFRSQECWSKTIIDLSKVGSSSIPELVQQWKKGKFHLTLGKELVEEARDVFEEELGDLEVITIDDLKISRVIQNRTEISTAKLVEKYGTAIIAELTVSKKVPQMRVVEI